MNLKLIENKKGTIPMKLYGCTLVLSLLASLSVSAACPVAPSPQYECKGRKLVTNASELAAYLENFNFNANKQTIKGITLSGTFTGESLNVVSPCPVIIKSGSSLNYSGDICLSSAKKVIGQDGVTLSAANIVMTAPERVILRNNLNATVVGQFNLFSTGSSIDSRAHIRHTSNVTAGSLNVLALRRATLGHTSTYNVSGKITLSSNGEDLPDDAELGNSEWSSIWRDTNIRAGELAITALERARISRGVTITAPKTLISAKSCSFNKTAVIDSAEKVGDCFSGRHPDAKLRYSPNKTAAAGETILFDAGRSTYLEGSKFFWSFYEDENNIISLETSTPTTSYSFTTLGRKKIELKIVTPEGFYDIARRRVEITGAAPLLPPTAILTADPSTGEAPLSITLDASASTDSDGVIVKYIFSDGTNFVETTEDKFTLIQENPGTFNYQIEVFDDSGLSSIATTEVVVTPEDTTGESAILAFFKYNLIPNGESYKLELIYESRTLNGKTITNAFYSSGPDTLPVGRKVLSHKDIVDFDSAEPVELTINVTDEIGGTATFTHTITPIAEDQKPNLQIDSIEFNPNEVVFFSNLIFDPYNQLEGIERYNLDFGDGTSQEIEGPWFQINHRYASAGLYNATLTAFGGNDESFSHTQEIEVVGNRASFELPIADFRVEQGDAFPGVRLYVDQSISPTAPIKQFLWSLGDDTTAYGREVIHFYDAGAYDVTLTAILEDGSTSVVKREVIVMRDAPNMIGDVECFDIGDLKTECSFIALDRFGDLSEVKIHFGDSEFSDSTIISVPTSGNFQEFTFEHQYQNAGTYRVAYQVLSNRGEVLDGETEVTINENFRNIPPIAILECSGNFNQFDCQAFDTYDPDGSILTYKFDMGNGDVFELDQPQLFYTYAEEGPYLVTLEVTDNLGDSTIAQFPIISQFSPNFPPIADFSCFQTANLSLSCEAFGSFDEDGFIETYEYSSSLLGNMVGSNATYTFGTEGSFEVTLTVTDNLGAETSLTKSFQLTAGTNLLPVVIASCFPLGDLRIECDATHSYDPNGENLSFDFRVDDSSFFSTSQFEYQSQNIKTIKVLLRVTNSSGLSSEKILEVDAVVDPRDAILAELQCSQLSPLTISCGTPRTIENDLTILWTIDGEVLDETELFIRKEFESTGEKLVSLSLSNQVISKVLTTEMILKEVAPKAAFEYRLNDSGEVVLDASQSNSEGRQVESYIWTINSQEVFSNNSGTLILDRVYSNGTEVELQVVDQFNSTDSISKTIQDLEGVSPDTFKIVHIQERGFASKESRFQVIAQLPSDLEGLSYKWNIEGAIYTEPMPTHIFSSRGEKEIYLEVTKENSLSELSYKFDIEEIEWSSLLESTYNAGDFLNITFENYEPASNPRATFDEVFSIDLAKGSRTDYATLIPAIYLQNREIIVQVEVDGELFEHSFLYRAPQYSPTPKESGISKIEELKQLTTDALSNSQDSQVADITLVNSYFEDLKQSFFEDPETESSHKYLEYALRGTVARIKAIQSEVSDLTVNSKKRKINAIEKALNFFIPSAHALDIEEFSQNRQKCFASLKLYKNVIYGLNIAEISASLPAALGAISLGAAAVGQIEVTAAIESFVYGAAVALMVTQLTKAIFLAELKDSITFCTQNIYFPPEELGNIRLNQSSFSVIENKKGLISGLPTSTYFSLKMGRFFAEGINKKNQLHKIMTKAYDKFSFGLVSNIITGLNAISGVIRKNATVTGNLNNSNLSSMDKKLSQITLGVNIYANASIFAVIDREKNDPANQGFEDIVVNKGVVITSPVQRGVVIREADIANPTIESGIVAENRTGADVFFKASQNSGYRINIQLTDDYFEGLSTYYPQVEIDDDLTVFGACKNEPMLFQNGGYVSKSAKVGPNIGLVNSFVCGKSVLKSTQAFGVIIRDSTISSSEMVHTNGGMYIQDSSISNSRITNCAEIFDSSITNSFISGASIQSANTIQSSFSYTPDPQKPCYTKIYIDSIKNGFLNIGPNVQVETDDSFIAVPGAYTGSGIVGTGKVSNLRIKNSGFSSTSKRPFLVRGTAIPEEQEGHMINSSLAMGPTSFNVSGDLYMYDSRVVCDKYCSSRATLSNGTTMINSSIVGYTPRFPSGLTMRNSAIRRLSYYRPQIGRRFNNQVEGRVNMFNSGVTLSRTKRLRSFTGQNSGINSSTMGSNVSAIGRSPTNRAVVSVKSIASGTKVNLTTIIAPQANISGTFSNSYINWEEPKNIGSTSRKICGMQFDEETGEPTGSYGCESIDN